MADEPKNPFDPGPDAGPANPVPGPKPDELPQETPPGVPPTPLEETESFWHGILGDKKLIYSTLGVLGFILVAGGLIYYFVFGKTAPVTPPDVAASVDLPSRIVSGQPFDITVNYSNRSAKTLKEVAGSFMYPQGFTFRESTPRPQDTAGRNYRLPDVSPQGTGQIKVQGLIDGQVGDKKQIKLELKYKTPDSSTTFVTAQTIEIELGAPDLAIALSGPTETTSGQEVLYTATYQNVKTEVIRDVVFLLTIPSEFTITETTPRISENKSWSVGDLAPNATGSLKVKGAFTSSSGLQRVIEVQALSAGEVLGRAITITQVQESPVVITQTLDNDSGSAVPGEILNYRLEVENRGNTSLTNVVLSTDLGGSAYDLSTLETSGGVLTSRTVTWTPGGIPDLKLLKPASTAKVSFRVKVSGNPTGGRSLVLTSSPKVTSFELKQPILGPVITTKVRTLVTFMQEAVYQSGAWPMRAGQETQFRITWRLTNTTNDLGRSEVMASLPYGSASLISASGGPAAGTASDVVWNIDKIDANTTLQATLIIKVTPSAADINKALTLLSNVLVKVNDSFIGRNEVFTQPDVLTPGQVQS